MCFSVYQTWFSVYSTRTDSRFFEDVTVICYAYWIVYKSLPPLTLSLSFALFEYFTIRFVRQLFTHFKCISNKNCDISRWAEPTVNRFALNASGVCCFFFVYLFFSGIRVECATAAPIIKKSATTFLYCFQWPRPRRSQSHTITDF